MHKYLKHITITLALLILLMMAGAFAGTVRLQAADNPAGPAQTEQAAPADQAAEQDASSDKSTTGKAIGAALTIAFAALAGAFSMGNAISKSVDGVARQPEAEGKIRTTLMLGLVFIETVVIYALIVAILIIFVM